MGTKRRTIDGTPYAIAFGYDAVGNVTSILYPGDTVPLTQTYDELNRLCSINDFAGSATTQGFWYDAAGRLTRMQYNNGIATDYQYNNRGLLSRIQSSVLDLNFVYDLNGNITSINDEVYTYDALNRLLTASQPAHNYTASYQYDNVGNRISQVEDGLTTSYGYNAVNELASSTGISYTYDARGNLTAKVKGADTWSYTYDKANRLTQVTKNGTTLGLYTYDANGIRAKMVEGGATTHYLALGHKNLYEKTGTIAAKHIFAGSQRIAEVKDGVVTYFHNDHLGSPRAVTNTSGTLIATTATRPFGQSHSTNNPTDYLFTGKELDHTGLYYFAARYYDPSVGRFMSQDPHWNHHNMIYGDDPDNKFPLISAITQSTNLYVYCGNNPLGYVDPDGKLLMVATGLIGAVVGGVVGAIYSYAKHGKVSWQSVASSAAIGGAIGLTGGAATAYLVTGSTTASSGMVVAGAMSAAATKALAKTADSLIQNAESLKRSAKVMTHLAERAYINSTITVQNIMSSADPVKDKIVANGLKWVVPGVYNRSSGVFELVVDVDTHMIIHFLFTSKVK